MQLRYPEWHRKRNMPPSAHRGVSSGVHIARGTQTAAVHACELQRLHTTEYSETKLPPGRACSRSKRRCCYADASLQCYRVLSGRCGCQGTWSASESCPCWSPTAHRLPMARQRGDRQLTAAINRPCSQHVYHTALCLAAPIRTSALVLWQLI